MMDNKTDKDAYKAQPVNTHLQPFIQRYMVANHQTKINETLHPKPTGYSYLNWVVRGHWQADFGGQFSSEKSPIFLTGQIVNQDVTVIQTGFFQHIVAEFTAPGFYQLTGIKGIDCRNRVIVPKLIRTDLELNFSGLLEQAEAFSGSKSTDIYLHLLEELLLKMAEKPRAIPDYISYGIELIEQADGLIRIENVCLKLSISQRQFNRRFTEIVGLSPKYFARVLQMKKALQALFESNRGYLCDIANEAGYYDEAHFIRVIQEFFEHSPSQFLNSKQETLFSFLDKSRAFLKTKI